MISRTYKYVKLWRQRTRLKLFEAMGNRCAICFYDKCSMALDFHHLDPNKKDFNIADGSVLKWEKLVEEVKKCILLCCRCHREIHAGITEIPSKIPIFNESLIVTVLIKETEKKPCNNLNCNNLVKANRKYCSRTCSSKHRFRIDWNSINLIEELKTKSRSQIGRELGITATAVSKRIRKMNPSPPESQAPISVVIYF